MIERRLLRQLEKVAARWRHRSLLAVWITIWLALSLSALAVIAAHGLVGWYAPQAASVLTAFAAVGGLAACVVAYRSGRDPKRIAHRVERAYPELNTSLLAAVDQRAQLPGERFGFLQSRVIEQVLRHAYRKSWLNSISPWQLLTGHFFNFATFSGMVALFAVVAGLERPADSKEELLDGNRSFVVAGDFEFEVDPGNAEIEKGTSLWVTARFAGALPPETTLFVERNDGTREQFAMTQSLKDPVFGARITEVLDPLRYHVEFATQKTESFRVTVFEYPELVRADAVLQFPEYTSMERKVVEDVRTITAVEGTRLTLECRLNKPVAKAELVDRKGNRTAMSALPDDPRTYAATFDLSKPLRLELHLLDAEDRANKQPPEIRINTVPNKPPDLKLVRPSQDLQVSPLEEVEMSVNAWDDFGLARLGLSYTVASATEEVVLAQAVGAKERTKAEYLLAFEELAVEPDQLVSYYFWAEDQGPDGDVRRVSSDMYFAEVRHFDEVFREGQAPPGGAPQQGMQAGQQPGQQLADLQKQIINATWKVMRREIAGTPSEKFGTDVDLLLESQTSALEQAEQMNEEITESTAMRHMLEVRKSMLDAVKHLSEAKVNSQIEALTPALASEQAAYQSLLRLRATEHRVTQGRQQAGGGGGGGNRTQQQLQQLQLNNEERRYEAESSAQQERESADTETRQVLNRLRELARRQGDLNERLKELQSALDEAESEKEKEEIRRQLQRLREEQERILRDIDDVRDRMERPENQERMADQQNQLEQTRENVRQASEALQDGRVSRAVTAGTRAEREFEELRDEFRRRSAGRYQEEMREMRREAQQLDEQQRAIAERLNEENQAEKSKTLRDTDQREELMQDLLKQRDQVEDLVDEMKEMIQEAETAEPLLASDLYETARQVLHDQVTESIEATARRVSQGFLDDAKQQERRVSRGIRELREGVEQAAEHVLGDESEALRKARDVVEGLRSDLDQEMERERGEDLAPQGNREGDSQRPGEATDQPSSPADNEGRPSDESQSESQSSGEQSGQGRPQGDAQEESQGGGQGGRPRRLGDERPADSAGQRQGLRSLSGQRSGSVEDQGGLGGPAEVDGRAPLTGDDFGDWSDRLRDVEEMVSDPELRAEAARIRDRARTMRRDIRRHSQPPNWDMVDIQVAKPLAELQLRIVEELMRRSSQDSMVPIDRDPVPPKFREQVRRYYERIGNGR